MSSKLSVPVATAGKGIVHLPPRTYLHFLHLSTWDHISQFLKTHPLTYNLHMIPFKKDVPNTFCSGP